jgi:hypothetical protein
MLSLLMLLLAPAEMNNLGAGKLMTQDPHAAVAVENKFMLPSRPPDCRTDEETMRAVEQVRNGERGECWVRDVRAFNRHGG